MARNMHCTGSVGDGNQQFIMCFLSVSQICSISIRDALTIRHVEDVIILTVNAWQHNMCHSDCNTQQTARDLDNPTHIIPPPQLISPPENPRSSRSTIPPPPPPRGTNMGGEVCPLPPLGPDFIGGIKEIRRSNCSFGAFLVHKLLGLRPPPALPPPLLIHPCQHPHVPTLALGPWGRGLGPASAHAHSTRLTCWCWTRRISCCGAGLASPA